jgi:hypothetical protein
MAGNKEPRLAWTLPDRLALEPARAAMEAWAALGVVPSALVSGPQAPHWLPNLVGTPPRLRLAARFEELEEHGYGQSLLLEPPCLDQAVALWLGGVAPAWGPFEPPAPWPRQVLPTTPFARMRCWVDEATASRLPSPLDQERRWVPLDTATAAPVAPGEPVGPLEPAAPVGPVAAPGPVTPVGPAIPLPTSVQAWPFHW